MRFFFFFSRRGESLLQSQGAGAQLNHLAASKENARTRKNEQNKERKKPATPRGHGIVLEEARG